MKLRNHVAKAACTALFTALLALAWTSLGMAQGTPGETGSGTSGRKASPSSGGGMMNGMGGMMGGSSGGSAGGMNGMTEKAVPSPRMPSDENDAPKSKMMGKSSGRKGCCMKAMQGMMRGGSGGMGNMGGTMGGSSSAPPAAPEASGSN